MRSWNQSIKATWRKRTKVFTLNWWTFYTCFMDTCLLSSDSNMCHYQRQVAFKVGWPLRQVFLFFWISLIDEREELLRQRELYSGWMQITKRKIKRYGIIERWSKVKRDKKGRSWHTLCLSQWSLMTGRFLLTTTHSCMSSSDVPCPSSSSKGNLYSGTGPETHHK